MYSRKGQQKQRRRKRTYLVSHRFDLSVCLLDNDLLVFSHNGSDWIKTLKSHMLHITHSSWCALWLSSQLALSRRQGYCMAPYAELSSVSHLQDTKCIRHWELCCVKKPQFNLQL